VYQHVHFFVLDNKPLSLLISTNHHCLIYFLKKKPLFNLLCIRNITSAVCMKAINESYHKYYPWGSCTSLLSLVLLSDHDENITLSLLTFNFVQTFLLLLFRLW